MLKVILTDEVGDVLSMFDVERDMNGEIDPFRLADSVKETIEMKFEVPSDI